MNVIASFSVPGIPAPKGSMRAMVRKTRKGVRAIVLHDNKRTGPWAELVTARAQECMGRSAPVTSAVAVHVQFSMPRPKSAKKRPYPSVKPDIDKLLRACLDAMTRVVWRDDSQVVRVMARKVYADYQQPGVVIDVFDEDAR